MKVWMIMGYLVALAGIVLALSVDIPKKTSTFSGKFVDLDFTGTQGFDDFVDNTTSGGGGDITGVFTNGKYLYGGGGIGDLYIYVNETELNKTIDARDSDTTYSAGSNLTLSGTTFSLDTVGVRNWLDNVYLQIGQATGVTPTAINLTSSTYTGSLSAGGFTGYKAGDYICSSEFPGSHMCNEFEVILYNNTNINGDAWVSAGGPKYVPANIPVNDCNGWTHGSAGTYLGNYWHFDSSTKGNGRAINCGTSLKLACCSY